MFVRLPQKQLKEMQNQSQQKILQTVEDLQELREVLSSQKVTSKYTIRHQTSVLKSIMVKILLLTSSCPFGTKAFSQIQLFSE